MIFDNIDILFFQSYILEDLDVFTNYTVSVALSNVNGTGPFSDSITNVSCDGGERERERGGGGGEGGYYLTFF